MRAEAGEAVIARSRFLPQLAYNLTHQSVHEDGADSTHELDHFVRFSQTVAEWGRENPTDVSVRGARREALFDFEDAVRSVLSTVRKKFFTVLLRRQQIAGRRGLLTEFRDRHETMRRLEKERRVRGIDVLTAELNVLNEESRINALETEALRQEIDLLHLVGLPVDMTGVHLQGELEEFALSPSEAVLLGLRRSTSVAEARAEVAEQRRVVREVACRHGPEIHARAGTKSETAAAGLELRSDEGVYALSAFAEQHLREQGFDAAGDFDTGYDLVDSHDQGWSAEVKLELPLFDGLRRRGEYARERAKLVQALHSLRHEADSVEARIRKAYQTILERRKELELLGETVRISKERLRVKEELKESVKEEVTDDELETFRNRFFADQDAFLRGQISLMEAQEDLRYAMRFFEPLPKSADRDEAEEGGGADAGAEQP
jgi:outer membrane protein TolC